MTTTLFETLTDMTAPHIEKAPRTAGFYAPLSFKVTGITFFRIGQFIKAAMKRAKVETFEDGAFYAEIPGCPGVWAKAKTRQVCLRELKETLAEWIELKRRDGDKDFSVLDGIDLNALP